MTILNESGIPDVLSPLHAVSGLAERFPGALVVVVGTLAEAHLVQSLPAAPSPNLPVPPRNPRVVFAVLDPEAIRRWRRDRPLASRASLAVTIAWPIGVPPSGSSRDRAASACARSGGPIGMIGRQSG